MSFPLALLAAPLLAGQAPAVRAQTPPAAAAAEPQPVLEFSADQLSYDEGMDEVVASGNVIVSRDGERLTADTVVYNRKSGDVTASGNVRLEDGGGAHAVADSVELSEDLRNGVVENVLLVLADGSRLAARSGVRRDGVSTLDRAVYSPCNVVNDEGCPSRPVWELKAIRVVHDPKRGRVIYQGARLELLGIPVLALPRLSHPDRFDRSETGLLPPEFRLSRELGGEMRIPWLLSFGADRDLTLSTYLYTNDVPVFGAEYRQLFAGGPIRLGGLVTYAKGQREDLTSGQIVSTPAGLRGAIDGNGEIAHGDGWQSSFSLRLTNDNNFLGHYQVSLDSRLRSTYALQRIEPDTGGGSSYFSLRGWYFQDLVQGVSARTVPVALPLIDYRLRLPDEVAGGQLSLRANSLGLYRRDGQSTARALASATWRTSALTGFGQRISLTGLLRGDVYHTDNGLLADEPIYAGQDGWKARLISLAAADVEWPFSGPLWGGVQTLTPRLQLVAADATANSGIPNEDSRAIDLEDSNLFALNRFPGYDRFEGGVRLTYGFDWLWSYPGVSLNAQIGQSHRFSAQQDLFPDGTGLSGRFSDFVGRLSVTVGSFVEVTERLRLDKDSLKVRRNETDLALGSRKTFVSIGYLKFNRHISLEDLPDHEEVRAGARVAFGRYWAVYGSTIVDLTRRDPLIYLAEDGFQPIRHRLGISYTDECLEFALGWKRNYIDNPNAREGNTFQFSLKLRNLG